MTKTECNENDFNKIVDWICPDDYFVKGEDEFDDHRKLMALRRNTDSFRKKSQYGLCGGVGGINAITDENDDKIIEGKRARIIGSYLDDIEFCLDIIEGKIELKRPKNYEQHKTETFIMTVEEALWTMGRNPGDDDQRQPRPTGNGKIVLFEVLKDLRKRAVVGKNEYGTMLRIHNGRNAMQDAYEELLDLCMYFKQALMEGESNDGWKDQTKR